MSAIHYLKLNPELTEVENMNQPLYRFEPLEFMHPLQENDKGASFVIISASTKHTASYSGVGLAKLISLRKDVIKLIDTVHSTNLVDYPTILNVVGCFEGDMEMSLAIEMNYPWLDVTSIRKLLKKYNQDCALWVEKNEVSLIHNTKLEPTYIGKWRQCVNNIHTNVGYTQSLVTGIKYEVI